MRPELVRTTAAYRAACETLRASGRSIALVPTLGALHHAHQALMSAAHAHGSAVAVSIFVNPTQFGPGEDYERYPRDLEADLAVCAAAGVELVFAPERNDMYQPADATRVLVQRLSEVLCGPHRPGHFEGVATIVTKLLTLTGPCAAIFGRKDYQQLQVIKRLVDDLFLPVQIVEHPTLRDADGLAASSRNRYLSAPERVRALALPRTLSALWHLFQTGERDVGRLGQALSDALGSAELDLEYAALADSRDLQSFAPGSCVGPGQAGVFLAARVGTTRLIDNVILGVDADPSVA